MYSRNIKSKSRNRLDFIPPLAYHGPAQPISSLPIPKEEAMHLSTFDNFIDDQIAAGVDTGNNVI
jgi:hypothetical protein